jgi:hypothetical protein
MLNFEEVRKVVACAPSNFQANDVAAFAGSGASFARVLITVLLILQSNPSSAGNTQAILTRSKSWDDSAIEDAFVDIILSMDPLSWSMQLWRQPLLCSTPTSTRIE